MKPTIEPIIKKLFPLTGNVQSDAVHQICIKACRDMWRELDSENLIADPESEAIKDKEKRIEKLVKQLDDAEKKINKLEDDIKINEGVRSHLATQVQQLTENASSHSDEEMERIISNRVEAAIAEANIKREYAFDSPARAEDYKRLVMAERVRTTVALKSKTMRPQLINWDVVKRFSKSPAPLIVYQADGRTLFMRWTDLYKYVLINGKYDPSPFTHFTIVPKCTLDDLINLDSDEQGTDDLNEVANPQEAFHSEAPTEETKADVDKPGARTICRGCAHRTLLTKKCTSKTCVITGEEVTNE